MKLIVVVGYDGPQATANPTALYCGRSSSEAEEARNNNTTAFRFEIHQSYGGLRKTNPRYVKPGTCSQPAPDPDETQPASAPAFAPPDLTGKKKKS